MKRGAGADETPDVHAYVIAVARALNADAIRRWDAVIFDAVVVLSKQFRYYSGRNVVIAWNHHFGWSLGIEGQRTDRVLIIGGLGIGRRPPPEGIADRVDELVADLLHLECRAPDTFPVPTLVRRVDSDTGPTDRRSSGW
ncbi:MULTISPECIES: DUF6292 family protein [unclassified Rhodococcus (in: high G+C Gram-positive bacteria)]|uniref:DUF6292 family protein n=1 Tax=unclassified Rhodococcus (in: high G+C Gram-positive bacteria) TaxID=192944 RepID=UPI0016395282|nr:MULTISPECIES: DUF6292 family protein [unclassified Rhodococcus (in: high G+C Gram-positive bacteria)]MBC2640769.1 hypothetical protein [Rhodococcus sp. 3A]MBC2894485.1 hypothetical protein [Rhodococcus sp. 4CII]